MKQTSLRLTAAAVGVIATTALVAGASFAHNGFLNRYTSSENREAVKEAIKTSDYSAWLEAVGADSEIAKEITEEKFNAKSQIHELKKEGKLDEAKALMEEYGFKGWSGMHGKRRHGAFDSEKHEAMNSAIEAGDYQAWLEEVGEENPFGEAITEENFNLFVQMHSLKKEGKLDEAKALAEQLGIKNHFGKWGRDKNKPEKEPK